MHELALRLYVALRVAHAGYVLPGPPAGPQMPRIAPRTFLSVSPRGECVVGLQWCEGESSNLDATLAVERASA